MSQHESPSALGRYHGKDPDLFKLAFKTSILTFLTLGIYRFWAKTRIRKYIWSSATVDGDAFEYTGTGLEKFLGFLVAIVILAIYMGLVQIALFFFGLNLFSQPETMQQAIAQIIAIYATMLSVMPLIFFAKYRARRYKLARTRWKGIRFGADKAAWGYVWRSIAYWLLSMVSLGALLPLMTFRLEKYLADRTWYGDAKFEQNGRWTTLYPAMKHLVIGFLILVAGVATSVAFQQQGLAVFSSFVGYIWLLVGMVSYRVKAFRYMTDNKTLGGQITFIAKPETATITSTILLGMLVLGLVFAAAMFVFFAVVSAMAGVAEAGLIVGVSLGYLVMLAGLNAAILSMIVQPIIGHVISNVMVENTAALANIRQRDADAGADAEGFADALDLGGAI